MKGLTLQEKALECLKLAIEVTETTKHQVFYDYQAHVRQVSITIHFGGWKPDKSYDERFECYTKEGWKPEAHKTLNAAIKRLNELM